MKNRLRLAAVALAAGAALTASSCTTSDAPPGAFVMPRIGHVFIIVLENKDFAKTFGASSTAVYLNKTLVPQGAFLTQYYGIGHNSLDNYIAMVSGQAPNPTTQADCQAYQDFAGAPTLDSNGQITGQGCVYPTVVETIADQLLAAGLTWKGYMEDMGNTPAREAAACGHPALNAQDNTQSATVGDQYATRHNPFMYFHTITDSPACARNDVALSALPNDLATPVTTANYVFITPNLCNDGHDKPCVDGAPGGLISADRFLQKWVPQILAAPAFQEDGLLMILFDESDYNNNTQSGDTTSCCSETAGPNSPSPGITGPGGGRVGAVFISPFIRPGTVTAVNYNHYSMLRSVEDMFGLAHLGFAAQTANDFVPFGPDIFVSGQ